MSCQFPPRSRRNASPIQQSRPVRATLPVALMKQPSPTKNTNSEEIPANNNGSSQCEHAEAVVVERPTLFLGPRGEKSKTLNLRSQPPQHHMRRTSSLDTLFLASHGTPETIYVGHFMVDRATQTPDEWNDTEFENTQWKPLVTSGEQLEVKYIRQKLQRTNHNNRSAGVLLCSQRQSPIHGDHSAVSNIDAHSHSGAFGVAQKPSLKTSALPATSRPIPITQGPRQRPLGSMEALNQEIEKLVLKNASDNENGEGSLRVFEPTPDGHRAPIAELFHSMKNSYDSNSNSRSHSSSPCIPNVPDNSTSPVEDESSYKLGSSPHINKFLSREPPDGCEKVKVIGEPGRSPMPDFPAESGLLKPEIKFVLLPSQSSAFCPLYKDFKSPLRQTRDITPPFSSTTPK